MSPEPRKQILVVDNDEGLLERIVGVMGRAGHTVKATWSGVEALNQLSNEVFDALFVGEHVADMYVGEFLERASHLASCPKAWVMSERRPGVMYTYGSRKFPVISQKALIQLFELDESQADAPTLVN